MTAEWVVTTCDCCGKKFINQNKLKSLIDVHYINFYVVSHQEEILGEFCCFDCLNKNLPSLIATAESETINPSTVEISIKRIRQPYTYMED